MQKIAFEETVEDSITGFTGKVIGFASYSTGCNQYLVAPPVGGDGAMRESHWFDESRIGAPAPANGGPVSNAPAPR